MQPGRRKRRVIPHLMEEESLTIVKQALPKHWVIREYRPDYGIDLAIETFDALPDDESTYQTLGEHFFVQLKSVRTSESKTITIPPRLNVAKYSLSETPSAADQKPYNVEVTTLRLETPLLNTIRAMGAAVVVHLFLVVLDTRQVFYVCLTDYIDKLIVPLGEQVFDQETIAIQIPVANQLSRKEEHEQSLAYVRFFAKRAKFYSAFNLFAYQQHELGQCTNDESRRRMACHFVGLLRELDIWNRSGWPIVDDYRGWLLHLESVLPNLPDRTWIDSHPCRYFCPVEISERMSAVEAMERQIWGFWRGLNILGRNYEEVCREFALPTYFELLRTSGIDQ